MDCIHLSKQVADCYVTFIKRQANECAHRLAKVACSNACFVVLIQPPSLLDDCLAVDLISDYYICLLFKKKSCTVKSHLMHI